jgi:nucleotide-binding universal stress UspA family protein
VAKVVVGVDGSDPARAALEFAAEEAALRKARLTVVSAWEIPPAVYGGGFSPGLDQATLAGFAHAADDVVEQAIALVHELQPTVECVARVEQGQPAQALIEESRDAELVVVGNRGRGGFASLLLGSVSQQVVHYASCPVTVVRGPVSGGEEA